MISDAMFEDNWKQRRDEVRIWWSKLSDSDVDQIAGRYERLVSVLRETYGYTRAQAEADIDRHLAPHAADEVETSR